MNSLFDLSGHVGLVTGGNSGIGLGYAKGLAQCGAAVAIWGTNPAKNDAAAKELSELGGDVHAVICDVGDQQAVEAAMAETVGVLGRVDSCFVNAGVGGRGSSFLDMTDEEWKRVLRVNLDGAMYTSQAALRHMVKRWEDGDTNGGSLVFTSSGSAFFGQPRGEHYASSKGAVLAMSRAIAVEFARYGVRSNAIVPGWIDTELASGALHWDKFIERNMPRTPARRWGSGDDFAGIAAYLASPAASYHTGDIITIDGGYYIA
jgi:NAD(P)-dependent dehydrogenase (short-subunit alcohol dehydrogenase family)